MSPALQIFLSACTLCGILLALVMIFRFRAAEASVRGIRLTVLQQRTSHQAKRLSRIIAAENTRLVAKGIDQGSLFLQGSHRVISEITFGILKLFPATQGFAQGAKETHDLVSEGLYGAFRQVSEHVGKNIAENLKKPKPRKPSRLVKKLRERRQKKKSR